MEVKTFKDLNLSPGVLSAIDELGFSTLTPVQASCIPLFLKNRKDVSVEAVTGSGKTLAFVIPMFEMLQKRGPFKKQAVAALIISPTRELATQTAETVDLFRKHIPGFSSILLIGGEHMSSDIMKMKTEGVNIIIATPGRLAYLFENQEGLRLKSCVKALEMLILDEADRLFDMGFEATLNTILGYLPKQRQTGLFSATQTKHVEDLSRAGLQNPTCISVKEKGVEKNNDSTPSTLSNFYMICDPEKKLSILLQFLRSNRTGKYMVFFSTCASVDYFSTILTELIKHTQVISIHGRMNKKRQRVFSTFRKIKNGILVCTDVMARGVDIPDINWVIQFDPPSAASCFVHRCGRTARIGKLGNALLMLLPNEETFVKFLELNKNVILEKIDTPEVNDVSPKIRKMAMKRREIFEKGTIAFVSYIRFYTKHECELLFRVKDLDLGKLANGFALLKLPKMPELKNKILPDFISTDVPFENIRYSDKAREKQRLLKLEEGEDKNAMPKKKLTFANKKKQQWTRANEKYHKKQLIRKAKRKQALEQKDLDELERDARLLKKYRAKKITKAEFEAQFITELEDM